MIPLEAATYLDSFVNFEKIRSPEIFQESAFRLARVEKLLELAGNPHKKLKVIHVAGTKGKGTTCAYIASILRKSGYRVGLYTSPHLSRLNERIRILQPHHDENEKDNPFSGSIPDSSLNRYIQDLHPMVEKIRQQKEFGEITYFEILTVLALHHFSENEVDFAVLETGLGGRLDATNAVDSQVAVITPISMDHVPFLGKSLQEIAAEKAAIIKNKRTIVIVAPQKFEAFAVIQEQCRLTGAKLFTVAENFPYKILEQNEFEQTFEMNISGRTYSLTTSLLGEHQAMNAATAVGVVSVLEKEGLRITPRAVHEGIASAIWPGRFEIVNRNPVVVLDCAHNPESCRIFAKTVKAIFPGKKTVLIFAVSADKDIPAIAVALNPLAGQVILTKSDHPRAYEFSAQEASALFPCKDVFMAHLVNEAVDLALKKIPAEGMIVVTGSIFVVGKAREYLRKDAAG